MEAAAAATGVQLHQLHLDEEDCLGLDVFVAELELVLGPRDRRPDQTQLLELLQKLQLSVAAAEPAAVNRAQRRCEAALADLLHRGLCPVVRMVGKARRFWPRHGTLCPYAAAQWRASMIAFQPSPPVHVPMLSAHPWRHCPMCAMPQIRALACGCMSRLFAAGDMLPLYGRVSALQGELQERDRAGGEVGHNLPAGGTRRPARHRLIILPRPMLADQAGMCQWRQHQVPGIVKTPTMAATGPCRALMPFQPVCLPDMPAGAAAGEPGAPHSAQRGARALSWQRQP
jgi:hypothetical protein